MLADELRKDRSRTKLAPAVTLYHVIVEATLAQPGQHFIEGYLVRRDMLPGFRAGMRNVALDEQRHIGFGVKLLPDLAARTRSCPSRSPPCCARSCPSSAARAGAARLGPRYTECFGFTLEEIGAEGERSFEKLRPRACRSTRFPARSVPVELYPASPRDAACAVSTPGSRGANEAAGARPGDAPRCCSTSLRRPVDHAHAPPGP